MDEKTQTIQHSTIKRNPMISSTLSLHHHKTDLILSFWFRKEFTEFPIKAQFPLDLSHLTSKYYQLVMLLNVCTYPIQIINYSHFTKISYKSNYCSNKIFINSVYCSQLIQSGLNQTQTYEITIKFDDAFNFCAGLVTKIQNCVGRIDGPNSMGYFIDQTKVYHCGGPLFFEDDFPVFHGHFFMKNDTLKIKVYKVWLEFFINNKRICWSIQLIKGSNYYIGLSIPVNSSFTCY